MTYNYGDFPNVALIGSRGYINYNPSLPMRQLGYPMLDKPDDKLLEGFVWHDKGDPNMLKRIIRAWGNVHKKGIDLGKSIKGIREFYCRWVRQRSQDFKLPFILNPPTRQPSLEPTPIFLEEVDNRRETVLRLERKKEGLQTSLNKASY